tara:strand:+ start:767 stop:991 length:225 start_codon:yes stop_codon:yes gene_type:complete
MDREITKEVFKQLSEQNFLDFGRDQICYVKPVYSHGAIAYGLFNANGAELDLFPDERTAKMAAFHGEMRTMPVH